MDKIASNDAFKTALFSLTLAQQRQVGARFTANVLDLTDGSCAEYATMIAEKGDASTEELENAYHAARQYFMATEIRPFSELDYSNQAAHFVAEACMICLGPTYGEHTTHHLAEVVAGHCRMARTCAAIPHEDEYPKLADAEESLKKEIDAQYRILTKYLEDISPIRT